MKVLDKIIRTILALIGETFHVITNIIKYVLGFIWILYGLIRGKDFNKLFHHLNNSFVHELKASLNVILDKES